MLIDLVVHNEGMIGYILIALVVAFLPLWYVAGADSRIDENDRTRHYHG